MSKKRTLGQRLKDATKAFLQTDEERAAKEEIANQNVSTLVEGIKKEYENPRVDQSTANIINNYTINVMLNPEALTKLLEQGKEPNQFIASISANIRKQLGEGKPTIDIGSTIEEQIHDVEFEEVGEGYPADYAEIHEAIKQNGKDFDKKLRYYFRHVTHRVKNKTIKREHANTTSFKKNLAEYLTAQGDTENAALILNTLQGTKQPKVLQSRKRKAKIQHVDGLPAEGDYISIRMLRKAMDDEAINALANQHPENAYLVKKRGSGGGLHLDKKIIPQETLEALITKKTVRSKEKKQEPAAGPLEAYRNKLSRGQRNNIDKFLEALPHLPSISWNAIKNYDKKLGFNLYSTFRNIEDVVEAAKTILILDGPNVQEDGHYTPHYLQVRDLLDKTKEKKVRKQGQLKTDVQQVSSLPEEGEYVSIHALRKAMDNEDINKLIAEHPDKTYHVKKKGWHGGIHLDKNIIPPETLEALITPETKPQTAKTGRKRTADPNRHKKIIIKSTKVYEPGEIDVPFPKAMSGSKIAQQFPELRYTNIDELDPRKHNIPLLIEKANKIFVVTGGPAKGTYVDFYVDPTLAKIASKVSSNTPNNHERHVGGVHRFTRHGTTYNGYKPLELEGLVDGETVFSTLENVAIKREKARKHFTSEAAYKKFLKEHENDTFVVTDMNHAVYVLTNILPEIPIKEIQEQTKKPNVSRPGDVHKKFKALDLENATHEDVLEAYKQQEARWVKKDVVVSHSTKVLVEHLMENNPNKHFTIKTAVKGRGITYLLQDIIPEDIKRKLPPITIKETKRKAKQPDPNDHYINQGYTTLQSKWLHKVYERLPTLAKINAKALGTNTIAALNKQFSNSYEALQIIYNTLGEEEQTLKERLGKDLIAAAKDKRSKIDLALTPDLEQILKTEETRLASIPTRRGRPKSKPTEQTSNEKPRKQTPITAKEPVATNDLRAYTRSESTYNKLKHIDDYIKKGTPIDHLKFKLWDKDGHALLASNTEFYTLLEKLIPYYKAQKEESTLKRIATAIENRPTRKTKTPALTKQPLPVQQQEEEQKFTRFMAHTFVQNYCNQHADLREEDLLAQHPDFYDVIGERNFDMVLSRTQDSLRGNKQYANAVKNIDAYFERKKEQEWIQVMQQFPQDAVGQQIDTLIRTMYDTVTSYDCTRKKYERLIRNKLNGEADHSEEEVKEAFFSCMNNQDLRSYLRQTIGTTLGEKALKAFDANKSPLYNKASSRLYNSTDDFTVTGKVIDDIIKEIAIVAKE